MNVSLTGESEKIFEGPGDDVDDRQIRLPDSAQLEDLQVNSLPFALLFVLRKPKLRNKVSQSRKGPFDWLGTLSPKLQGVPGELRPGLG